MLERKSQGRSGVHVLKGRHNPTAVHQVKKRGKKVAPFGCPIKIDETKHAADECCSCFGCNRFAGDS